MANEVTLPTLQQAISAIGNAHAYIGSFFVVNSAVPLGQKQGRIEVNLTESFIDVDAPEITGPEIHDSYFMGGGLSVTVPLIVQADGLLWAKISPTGTVGGGFDNPQKPVLTSFAIIPDNEVGGGLKYDGTTWTRLAGNGIAAASGAGAAPINAIWMWKVRFGRGNFGFGIQDNFKVIIPVTAVAIRNSTADTPAGQRLYTIGDPVANLITNFKFSMT